MLPDSRVCHVCAEMQVLSATDIINGFPSISCIHFSFMFDFNIAYTALFKISYAVNTFYRWIALHYKKNMLVCCDSSSLLSIISAEGGCQCECVLQETLGWLEGDTHSTHSTVWRNAPISEWHWGKTATISQRIPPKLHTKWLSALLLNLEWWMTLFSLYFRNPASPLTSIPPFHSPHNISTSKSVN